MITAISNTTTDTSLNSVEPTDNVLLYVAHTLLEATVGDTHSAQAEYDQLSASCDIQNNNNGLIASISWVSNLHFDPKTQQWTYKGKVISTDDLSKYQEIDQAQNNRNDALKNTLEEHNNTLQNQSMLTSANAQSQTQSSTQTIESINSILNLETAVTNLILK